MINRIAVVGCGNVGTALLELLREKKDELARKYGFEYKVVLVSDLIKGVALNSGGIDLGALLDSAAGTGTFGKLRRPARPFEELLDLSRPTVLAECTPTDLSTGEPGLSHIRAALGRGVGVATTNKGPVAMAFDELHSLAEANGVKLRYEGVVMSGTPLIDMLKNGIVGCAVSRIEGILNGTTNFILTRMYEGADYAESLSEARKIGYAEADPTGDVDGWDAAVKVSILAKILFGRDIRVNEVARTGIAGITASRVAEAKRNGRVVKLIAGIVADGRGVELYVRPEELPLSHPLASVGGATNAVTVETDNLGVISLSGPGAGRRETGQALLSDMIRMTM